MVNEVCVYTEPVLNCLLYALQQPQLACAAATALQSICAACRTHMSQHFSGLVQIVQSMDTFCISNDAAIGLLKGVAIILGRLPHEQINDSMKQICLVQVNPLCELVHVSIFQFLFRGLQCTRQFGVAQHTNYSLVQLFNWYKSGSIHECTNCLIYL